MLNKPQAIILTESNSDHTCTSSVDWEDIADQMGDKSEAVCNITEKVFDDNKTLLETP